LQCAAVWLQCGCSALQCVAECCSVLQCVAVCCSVLQCVAACCSVLQCVAVCCSVLQCVAVCSQYVAVCCSALQCVCSVFAVCLRCVCSVLQYDAVCCKNISSKNIFHGKSQCYGCRCILDTHLLQEHFLWNHRKMFLPRDKNCLLVHPKTDTQRAIYYMNLAANESYNVNT